MVRPSDTEPPSNVAATVTRHPVILGSLRVAFALGASGPAWLTAFASDSTVMALAKSSDPFTIVTAVAACGFGLGCISARRSAEDVAGSALGTAATGNAAGAASAGAGSAASWVAGEMVGSAGTAASAGAGSAASGVAGAMVGSAVTAVGAGSVRGSGRAARAGTDEATVTRASVVGPG